jgi:hypothetical protein
MYAPRPALYPILFFLAFPFAAVLTWLHVGSQILSALVMISSNLPSSQGPRRLSVAKIATCVIAFYAIYIFAGQFILLSICTWRIHRTLQVLDKVSTQLLLWGADWTEGDPVPLARLLSLKPLLDQGASNYSKFRNVQVAYGSVIIAHLYTTFFILFPTTYFQIREIRRQLADLRSVRRNMVDSIPSRNPFRIFKGVFAALFVRHDAYEVASAASASTENARARLALLEAICKNMWVSLARSPAAEHILVWRSHPSS